MAGAEDLNIGGGTFTALLPDGTTNPNYNQIGSHTLLNGVRNALQNGCLGDGTTNDRAALNTLANVTLQPGGGTIFFGAPYSYRISSDITFPSNVTLQFAQGAALSIDTGVTVTVNGPIRADQTGAVFAGLGSVLTKGFNGAVIMTHDSAGNWSVIDPNGVAVDISASTTNGFQEGYDYAYTHKYPFLVYGAGITHDEIARSRIYCSTPVQFRAGEDQYVKTVGVDMVYTGNMALDFIVFDTMDISEFHIGGQIIYPGNGSVIRLLPTNTLNTGGFIGMTSSTIHFHSVVVSDGTGAPDPTHGGILKATCAGHAIIGMTITIDEAQGGVNQFLVENPTASVSTSFTQNNITLTQLHNFSGIGIAVGTSATHATQLAGNVWKAIINAGVSGSTCISTYGIDELYQVSISGDIGIVLGSSASENLFMVSRNFTNTMWTDGSTAKNCIRIDSQGGVNGYTPVTFANLPNPPHTGMHATVTNSNTNTWGATIAGGGAFVVGAFYNGSVWTVESK